MGILLASVLTILVVESFPKKLFFSFAQPLFRTTQKSKKVLLSKRISDHWKEKVLLKYSMDLMKCSIILGLLILALLSGLALGAWGFDWIFHPTPTTFEAISSPFGWLVMTLVAITYLFIRNRFVRT